MTVREYDCSLTRGYTYQRNTHDPINITYMISHRKKTCNVTKGRGLLILLETVQADVCQSSIYPNLSIRVESAIAQSTREKNLPLIILKLQV